MCSRSARRNCRRCSATGLSRTVEGDSKAAAFVSWVKRGSRGAIWNSTRSDKHTAADRLVCDVQNMMNRWLDEDAVRASTYEKEQEVKFAPPKGEVRNSYGLPMMESTLSPYPK